MAVFNADMQGEGRGSFLCLLGVCLIAIAAAAAALDPWSLGSQIITDQESGGKLEWSRYLVTNIHISNFQRNLQLTNTSTLQLSTI